MGLEVGLKLGLKLGLGLEVDSCFFIRGPQDTPTSNLGLLAHEEASVSFEKLKSRLLILTKEKCESEIFTFSD